MKPYNGSRRALLKAGNQTRKLMDIMSEETKAALLGQEIKLKSSSVSIGFNPPSDPQTFVKGSLHIGGHEAFNKCNELEGRYHDAVDAKREHERFVVGWRKDDDDVCYVELRLGFKGNAKHHAERFGNALKKVYDLIPSDGDEELYFKPKVLALDDNTVAVGLKIHYPNKFPMFDDFKPILKNAGQHVHWSLELGTSLKEIFESGEPIAKLASLGGFKMQHKHCFISNLKKVLIELMKDEEKRQILGAAMMFAPATMLTLTGNLDITFEDFDEIQ